MVHNQRFPNWRILTASAEDSALSLPPPYTQQWPEGSFHCTSSAQAATHPSASTPPSPCACPPTATIRPFPKTFTSSFPVQNPKIIVRSYLQPGTPRVQTKPFWVSPAWLFLTGHTKLSHIALGSSGTPEHACSFVCPWIMKLHFNNLPWSEAEQVWVMLGHPGDLSSFIGENASAQGAASHSSLQGNTECCSM